MSCLKTRTSRIPLAHSGFAWSKGRERFVCCAHFAAVAEWSSEPEAARCWSEARAVEEAEGLLQYGGSTKIVQ